MDHQNIVMLRAELDRLSAELQETTEEKFQAAQYGLVVLEENSELKHKCSDLESECDVLRLELKQMKEALAESQSNHKRTAADGENREESLLKETASKEAKLMEKIDELQGELKQIKSFLTNTSSENERLNSCVQTLNKEFQAIDKEKTQLRDEIKQCKAREMRHLQDFSELEEENISLLKQVSVLKENQVEFEGLKHELKRREEEIDILNGQIEELVRLKDISERHLEEALETLKSEREQKNELRRELSGFLQYDSIGNLQVNFEDEFDSGYNGGGLNKSNGEILMSTPRSSDIFHPGPKLASDLFTELSITEIQKLKQQLLQVDREKESLEENLQELQKNLDSVSEALGKERQQNVNLTDQINVLKMTCDFSHADLDNRDDLLQCTCGHRGMEMSGLRKELKDLKQQYESLEERYRQERAQWESTKNEVAEKLSLYMRSEQNDKGRLSEVQEELRASQRLCCDFQSKLTLTQDELMSFTEDLALLYNHVCMRNNLTPNRVMLDYYKDGKGSRLHFRKRKSSEFFGKLLVNQELDMTDLQSGEPSPLSSPGSSVGSDFGDSAREPLTITHLLAIVKDQLKHLQGAIALSWHHTSLETIASEMDKDKEVLVEEIMKLKSLLSTKREQIATLRTVLKANKQTAEVAMSNLKSKYENEKALVSETMLKLRHELKALKEDAATFSSLRSVFANRCDQYVTQLEDMQRQLVAAEDEKKTLNTLLRMAIQQKLALTQRLECQGGAHDASNVSPSRSSKGKTRTSKSKLNWYV
ncbi:bicaudal D homolog 2-like [Pelobates cultripes]|uniref:Bicaudal D homolog 2-like n=1 Tax=Pelobates cultripes TaxID=61616 RepID=A0AAD1T2K4_PELCU|nr:bicaudal D homolog 2-like [Pelobates cultripes]CAH2316390.1 bicaudal D homolog 2-like [Pelobates cultripes]